MPTRRQFLAASSGLLMAASTSGLIYRYLSRPPSSMTVNYVGMQLGHLLRDRTFTPPAHAPTAQCDCLILGSGTAGLSAAWHLVKSGQPNFLIATGFERHGNNAAYTFSHATGSLNAPTGAHYLAQPSRESTAVRELLRDLGILKHESPDGKMVFSDTDLVHAPDERIFYPEKNQWFDGLLQPDSDSQRFFQFIQQIQSQYGSDGKKWFAIPIVLSSQDSHIRALDTLTFGEWLKSHNYTSPNLLNYLDYACRDDYGQGIHQVSAFAGLHYFAARGHTENTPFLTWANGLNYLAEKISELMGLENLAFLPQHTNWAFRQPVACAVSAVQIREHADHVEVWLRHNLSGDFCRVLAKKVICAMPLMVAARVIQFPERYGLSPDNLPEYAPWLIGNFVLNPFPKELPRSHLAWDNVVYGSRALGYVVATHQQIRVAKPPYTIFTAYCALNHDSPQNIRQWLIHAQPSDLLSISAQDLLKVYGKKFWQSVQHIDLTVRAHAMSVPKVGYLSLPHLHQLRQHQSRLVFAHSDLSGYSVFEEAVYWGVEAAKRIVGA